MRTVLVAFIGVSCGAVLGLQAFTSTHAHTNTNETPVYLTFAHPAVDSGGRAIEMGEDYVIVSYSGHLVEFQITPETTVLGFSFPDARNNNARQWGKFVPIPIARARNKIVIVSYKLHESILVAEEIIAAL